MDTNDIIALSKAGFTAEQIAELNAHQQAPTPEPIPAIIETLPTPTPSPVHLHRHCNRFF